MNTQFEAWLPVPLQLYLANVAVISVIVCGGGLIVERLCRWASLPFRHIVLVGALVSALATPIVIGVMLVCGRSLIQFDMGGIDARISAKAAVTSSLHSEGFDASGMSGTQEARLTSGADKTQTADTTASRVKDSTGAPLLNDGGKAGRWGWLKAMLLVGTSLSLMWIAGCVLSAYRLSRGLVQLRCLCRAVHLVADVDLCELAAVTARQLGLSNAPKVYESEAVLSPLSVGLFHPMIVLPQGIALSFDRAQLQGLFLHEMAHIVRRDHSIGALQRLATILFWWNGLTRRACARISAIREQICDDISTAAGNTDVYAAMLVELAGHVVHSLAVPGTIGVFEGQQRDFSQRIHRLLDPNRRIAIKLNGRAKIAAVICFVLLLLPATAAWQVRAVAVEQPAPAQKTNEPQKTTNEGPAQDANKDSQATAGLEAPPFRWPQVLRGVIKDTDGKPIAGAKVRLDFEKIHEYSIGRWDELLDSQSQVTGDNGEFRFDATKLPKLTHRPFLLTITATADGYAAAKWWNWYSHSDVNVGEHLANVKMLPGRVVRGRCVDPDGVPVSGAIVKMASDYDPKAVTQSGAWDPRKTRENGTFEFSIPRDSEAGFEIWVVHPEWAPQRATLAKGSDTFGDIRLQKGASLQGAVRDADGKPVLGTVVAAVSKDRGELKSLIFQASVAAKTDAQGNYAIQPLAGVWKVYLTQAEENNNSLENRFVVADGPPPLVEPARVDLVGSASQSKDFRAGPTLKVRGTVRWPDGRPVERCEVRADYFQPDNGPGIWFGRTVTDDQGRYEIELPNPIDDVDISVIGAHDEHGVLYRAFPVETVDAKAKYQQGMKLYPLTGDLNGMDWALKPEKH